MDTNVTKKEKDEVLEVIEALVYKIMYKGAYSNVLLNTDRSYHALNSQARKFVSHVVYGTIENWILLNYILNSLAKEPKKIKKDLRCLLAAGIYVLRFLDRKEPAVVVNRFVNYTKYAKPHAKGFVNFILRNYLREEIVLPQGLDARSLSIQYSHPEELVQFFIDEFGIEESIKILKANNTPSTLSCRVNTRYFTVQEVLKMLEENGVSASLSPLCEDAIEISSLNGVKIEETLAFQEGAIYIQDISSILHHELVEVKDGDFILDLCSAPGGKITAIAQDCNETNRIYACDIGLNKLDLIKKNVKRLKLEHIPFEIMSLDATVFKGEWENQFDVVIADVPCSGLGVIKNRPEIRYRFDLSKMKELLQIQASILQNAFFYLKEGGILIYSTCTIYSLENERQIEKFLKKNPNASVCNINIDSINGQIHGNMIKLIQSNNKTDGFFACKIKKGRLENL